MNQQRNKLKLLHIFLQGKQSLWSSAFITGFKDKRLYLLIHDHDLQYSMLLYKILKQSYPTYTAWELLTYFLLISELCFGYIRI